MRKRKRLFALLLCCAFAGCAPNEFAEIVYASPEAEAQLQMPPMPLQTVPKLFSFEPVEGTE